jgi:hypothetical protein
MGTNYYTDGDPPCSCCGRGGEELHIGKSSMGWQFLFAPYPDRGLTSFKAWREFLADREIRDEYGHKWALNDLVELVEKKREGINSQTATREQWGPSSRDGESADPEGYRFSSTSDFS